MIKTILTTYSEDELYALIDKAVGRAVNQALSYPSGSTSTHQSTITRSELRKRLQVSEPTIIRWEKKGIIPCLHIGNSVRYNWDAVIKALESKK